MTAQVLFFNVFSEKELHLNAAENFNGLLKAPTFTISCRDFLSK